MCDIHLASGYSVVHVQRPVIMHDEEEHEESSAPCFGHCPLKNALHVGLIMCSDLFVPLRLCYACVHILIISILHV